MYLWCGLAPSSQIVGSFLEQKKMIYWKHVFLLNPPCKFSDFLKILLGDYCQTVFYR